MQISMTTYAHGPYKTEHETFKCLWTKEKSISSEKLKLCQKTRHNKSQSRFTLIEVLESARLQIFAQVDKTPNLAMTQITPDNIVFALNFILFWDKILTEYNAKWLKVGSSG